MRPLPIPVSASLFLNAHPWRGDVGTRTFADLLRHLLPSGKAPKFLPMGHMEVRILFIEWVQISYVRLTTTRSSLPPATSTGPVSPPAPPPPKDPLVIDFSGAGPQTTGFQGARPFDLAGDGNQRLTSFVKDHTAFLALDLNGNGRIDSGKELFGDQHGAQDGYEELRKYDLNADGQVDAQDPVFANLKLLFGDGRLASISDANLRALSLHATRDGRRTASGDLRYRQATAQTTQGATLATYALGLHQFNPAPTSATLKPAPP